MFIPTRLSSARKSRGLSKSELAELLNCHKSLIRQFEIGIKKPSKEEIMQFSFVLKYPVGYFEKPLMEISAESSAIFFRYKDYNKYMREDSE